MATLQLRLSDDEVLAEYVELDQFKGLLQQRLAIGPDTLAMLLRDGEIATAAAGGHFTVGGLWQAVKDAFGGRHAIRLLIADLKPFQLGLAAQAITQDDVQVACEFTLEFQVNPDEPAGVLGMMSTATAIPKSGVLKRVTTAILERVLNGAVRRVTALELRGNKGLQDMIQADTTAEVERIASDVGLLVRSVTVAWTDNPEETAVVLKRQKDRDEDARDHDHRITMRQVERQTHSTTFRLNSELSVEKTRAANDFELRDLLLSNEIRITDSRDSAAQTQEARTLDHRLKMSRAQRLEGLKSKLESEQNEFEIARLKIQIRALESEIVEKDTDRALKIENDRHRRRMEMARYALVVLAVVAFVLLLARFITSRDGVTEGTARPASPTSLAPQRPATPPSVAGEVTATTSPGGPAAAPDGRTAAMQPSPRPAPLNAAAVSAGRPLVLVVNTEGSLQSHLTSVLAKAFAGNGGAFLPEFVRTGFAAAHAGDTRTLQMVPGIERVPLILLAVSATKSDANIFEGMRRANLTLDVRVFRPSSGFASDSVYLDEVGAGFSDSEATSNAAERAAIELKRAVGN